MLARPLITLGAASPAATSTNLVAPGLLFILAATAAVGLILLLPGRREVPIRRVGGVVLAAAGIIFAVLLSKLAAGMNAYFWIFAVIAVVSALRVITHPKPVYSALYFVLTVMASAGLFVLLEADFMAAALVIIYAGAILVTYVFVIMLASQAAPTGTTPMVAQMAEHDAVSREPIAASAVGFALLGILLLVIFDKSTAIDPNFSTSPSNHAISQDIVSEVFSAPTTRPSVGPDAALGTQAGVITRSQFTASKTLSYSTDVSFDASAQLAATKVAPASTQPTFIAVGGTQKLGEFLFDKQLVNLELAGLILTVAMVGAIVIARKKVVGGPAMEAGQLTAPATPIDDNPHSIPVVGTDNPRQKEYPET